MNSTSPISPNGLIDANENELRDVEGGIGGVLAVAIIGGLTLAYAASVAEGQATEAGDTPERFQIKAETN